jgi:hypothetical protein
MKQGEKEERPSNGDKQKEKREVCMTDLNLSLFFSLAPALVQTFPFCPPLSSLLSSRFIRSGLNPDSHHLP